MALQLLVGADPEAFIFDGDTPISAFGLVPGDKENPFKVNQGAVQVDGMAFEFNIDPAADEEQFVSNIQTVMSQMADMVPQFRILATPVAHFGAEYIDKQPDKAKELGCNPDFNAYTQEENEPPNASLPFRTGAGHVHIGWCTGVEPRDPGHYQDCCAVIKQLDVCLGLPSVLFDANAERREMYGKAGAFRPKSYGCEYRVLSNEWVSNEKLQRWVYRATINAIRRLEAGEVLVDLVSADELQRIINTSDAQAAKELCAKLNIELPEGV